MMGRLHILWAFILVCFTKRAAPTSNASSRNGEYRLKQTLLVGHDSSVRPVKHDADKVLLKFDMALQQIIEVNEKDESITMSVYLRQYWNETNLHWNSTLYDGLKSINLMPDKLWLPDLTLYNNVEKENIAGNFDQLTNRVILYNDGRIKWLAPAILSSKCKMNIRYFPFDTQYCNLTIGSWAYHGFELDLKPESHNVDIGAFNKHSEWRLVKALQTRNVETYGCCTEPYPQVIVTFVLKRRPLFYVLNLILPMILIGVLTLLSFFLPAQSGERLSFAVTLLLAMTVFMLIVTELIPASSETIPLLGIYFTAVMIEMVLMIFTMCYTMRLHLKNPSEDEPLPRWLENIVYNGLAYLCRIRRPRMGKSYELPKQDIAINQNKVNNLANGDINDDKNKHALENELTAPVVIKQSETTPHLNGGGALRNRKNTMEKSPNPQRGGKDVVTSLMAKSLSLMTDKYKVEECEKLLKYKYEICAQTIDCVSLFVYIFSFIVITLAYIFSNPIL